MLRLPGARDRAAAPGAAPGPATPPAHPLRGASGISVAAVLVVLVVQLAAPGVWAALPWLPFAVGLLAGLPHGALDHLVPRWTAPAGATAATLRRTAALLVGYVVLAAITFVLARLLPVTAIVVLLLGSVLHFGSGETAVADQRAGRRGPPGRWVGFGAAAVVGPFVTHPAIVAPVLDVLAPGAAPVLLATPVLRAAAGLAAVAVLIAAVLGLRAGRRAEVAELALLVALVVVVPPLPAFGVYFGAWHGLRHLARLVALDPANAADLRAGRLARPWGRIAVQAAAPTAAVLAALAVLLLVPGLFPRAVAGLESAGLALVLALTVPHMLVVALLDRRQRPDPGPARRNRIAAASPRWPTRATGRAT